jgi:RND superfamily putative drug exporter
VGLERLGKFAYRWRALLTLAAIVLGVVSAFGGTSVFDRVKPFGFQDPHSQSARAYDELEAASGQKALADVELLIQPQTGSPTAEADAAAQKLSSIPKVTQVVTPTEDPSLLSPDQRSALVLGFLEGSVGDPSDVGAEVRNQFAGDPDVAVGGTAPTVDELTKQTQDDLERIELLALPVLLLLSLVVFRGLVAALLPILVGGLSILTTLLLLDLLTHVMDIDSFAINIVTGLGLGLAIDYSLFLVTRFREELAWSGSTEQALTATMGAIGPMVVFSGLTVAVSLISLTVFPQRFLYSIGVGGALVALASVFVCLLFLPAVLALLGNRVNALAPRGLQRPPSDRRWRSLAGFVLRYPVGVAIVAAALMVTAGIPFLRVELTRADADVLPNGASAREVEDTVRERFMSDPGDQILVAVPRSDQAGAEDVVRRLQQQPTVGSFSGPVPVGPNRVVIHAQIRVDPFSDPAVDTVMRIRATAPSGTLVAGPTAELIDQRHSLEHHIPLALALILSLTAVILLVMTGSVLLPVIALVMNALTVSVAFGVLVWVFQDGRLESTLDYSGQGALDSSIPILLFAVAFGLSTDYGVFLLQRIAEARRTESTESAAIATGVARSGRAITSAAILFAVAMGAFAFSELIYVKEIAIGAAIAVLVDATIVRPFLFPAILRLLGRHAWWGPRWLRYASFRAS